MIARLRGRLLQVTEEGIIIDTGGIGWSVRTPSGQSWPQSGAEVAVHTYLAVRENAMELYGFTQPEGLRLFNLLLGVTGIGPRGAMQIMGAASPKEIVRAIVEEDTIFLTSLPGIGNKKAQRLLLELKDKIIDSDLTDAIELEGAEAGAADYDEALAALMALGYKRDEITPYLKRIRRELDPGADTTFILQEILKALGREGKDN